MKRLLCLALSLVSAIAIAQITVDSIRQTPYDYACVDGNGTVLSGHQRQDKAITACQNRKLADPEGTYDVQGGRWRMIAEAEAGIVIVAPPSEPPPEPSNLEADYTLRTSIPGVVWHHDFETDAEVDAFRFSGGYSSGNDPDCVASDCGLLRRITSDSITGGGSLEYEYPASRSPRSVYWWRPFAPMNTGSGKASNDPAASGTLTVRSWAPTDGGSQLSNFANGWYGHPDTDDANFDGHDFYLQVRVKMDPNRTAGANSSVNTGKFVWLTTAEGAQSLSNGEVVVESNGRLGYSSPSENYVDMYSLGVNGINSFDPLIDASSGTTAAPWQPNNEDGVDWYYSGGWDTLLIHHRPGVANTTSGADASRLEIWAQTAGDGDYTKIWDQEFGNSVWEARNGLQALILGGYQNGSSAFTSSFYHRFDQVIFSKDFIPAPQSGAMPSWYPSSAGEVVEINSGTTIDGVIAATGYSGTYGGITKAWSGGSLVYIDGQPHLVINGAGHTVSDGDYNGILAFGPLYGAGADTPQWFEWIPPSDTADVQEGPLYADGRLAAAHTYNNVIGVGDKYYQVRSDAYWANGNSDGTAAYYDNGGQTRIATMDNQYTSYYGAVGYWLGKIYWHGAGSQPDYLRIYDIPTDTWSDDSAVNGTIAFNNYVSGAVDHDLGGFLVVTESQSGGSSYGAYWDLSDLSRLTGFSAPPTSMHNSLLYDPTRKKFVGIRSGSLTVDELDAPTLAAGTVPSWTTRTFSGDTPATGEPEGTFGRAQYVHQLKGYIVVPRDDSHVYFYRSE